MPPQSCCAVVNSFVRLVSGGVFARNSWLWAPLEDNLRDVETTLNAVLLHGRPALHHRAGTTPPLATRGVTREAHGIGRKKKQRSERFVVDCWGGENLAFLAGNTACARGQREDRVYSESNCAERRKEPWDVGRAAEPAA